MMGSCGLNVASYESVVRNVIYYVGFNTSHHILRHSALFCVLHNRIVICIPLEMAMILPLCVMEHSATPIVVFAKNWNEGSINIIALS